MPPVPLAWAAPFAGLLLAIAAMPLVAAHWWEKNRNKALVAAAFATPVALWACRAMPDVLERAGWE